MAYLDEFSDEERLLILSMPVRAGYWISQADDYAGTDRDEKRETFALEKSMKAIFAKTHDDAFTNDVMEGCLAHPGLWPQWQGNAATVLDDLPKALRLVKDRMPVDADQSYRKSIWFIANTVAQAASEAGAHAKGGLIGKLLDRVSVKADMKTPENISKNEKAALQQLLQILKG